MSLINQVLKDLEKRQAEQPREPAISGELHTIAVPSGHSVPRGARSRLPLVGVSIAVVSAVAIWIAKDELSGRISALFQRPSPVADVAAKVQAQSLSEVALAAHAVGGESIDQQVETALMIPVFQLSAELTNMPAGSPAHGDKLSVGERSEASASPMSSGSAASTNRDSTAAAKTASNASAQQGKSLRAIQVGAMEPVAGDPVAGKPQKPRPAEVKEAVGAQTQAKPPMKETGQSTDHRVVKPAPDANLVEEVVIPSNVVSSSAGANDQVVMPIEKQARRLTDYERAENAFRQGVAELRRGRVRDAEERFRAAIAEDHSHSAAHSALVGILVDSGRFEDAEGVLVASLRVNPRQPTQAKILARLQVERDDLDSAISTLIDVVAYAENDPEYHAFLAAVLQRANKHEMAVSEFREALALGRPNPVWLMGLGISLRSLGENEHAREAFQSAGASRTLPAGLQAFVMQQSAELQQATN